MDMWASGEGSKGGTARGGVRSTILHLPPVKAAPNGALKKLYILF